MPDEVITLLRLLAQGATLQEAGKQIGVSRTQAHRLVQRFGRDVNRRTNPRLSGSIRAAIRDQRRHGRSINAVATALQVSRTSVRRHSSSDATTDTAAKRCPGCGGRTMIQPCPVCTARAAKGIR